MTPIARTNRSLNQPALGAGATYPRVSAIVIGAGLGYAHISMTQTYGFGLSKLDFVHPGRGWMFIMMPIQAQKTFLTSYGRKLDAIPSE